jgi:hypothetical protein
MNIMMAGLCLLIAAAPLLGQERDTPRPVVAEGGFIELHAGLTLINGSTGVLVGGGLHGIFGRHARVGIAGAFLANTVHGEEGSRASAQTLRLGYGGISGEYVIEPERLAHFSASMLLGAGSLVFHGPINTPRQGMQKTGSIDIAVDIDPAADAFLIAEPGAGFEVNIAENIRIYAGAGYRFIYGIGTEGAGNASISGPAGTLVLRVGVF